MTDSLLLVVGLLADDAPRDTGPDFGKASPFGLVVIVILLIGTSRAAASASASAVHCCQCTGLSACWRR